MGITDETYLPSEEELTVTEVNVSGPVLKAAAHHLGNACLNENNEFMLCRHELGDPRKCLKEGKAVTNCALNFFRQVKNNCATEFTQYVNCIDRSSSDQSFLPCRKTQGVFDKCMFDKLNMCRPAFDQYARVQVHHTDRPRPPVEGPAVYPDAAPYLPEGVDKPPAKYGARFHWIW
ncbi:nadh-ubiquinone oxidoreductase [Holotrichia oblita]|uniref:Nadh-ubiquinone oxidoreductase n=1 Tax=Holotrichia oblita TaxID=644536 RepID=A0ACB9TPS1_HOLOL|nr:nadh-ubiquinone oxidoreductase [Holotrichia oblita]